MSRRWTPREGKSSPPAGTAGQARAGRELSVPRRVPASMPGRIWESSAGPGRCVRALSGRTDGRTEGGRKRGAAAEKGQKKKKESSSSPLFYMSSLVLPQHTGAYREKPGARNFSQK